MTTRLARAVREPDLSEVRYLIMDEFPLFKDHRYASVVLNAETRQVLWVGEGRSRAAIRPVFEWRTTIPDRSVPCPLDRVNRQFTANQSNQLWVPDFTYVST